MHERLSGLPTTAQYFSYFSFCLHDKLEPLIPEKRRYPPPITNQGQATVPHDVSITLMVSISHALRETALKEYLSPWSYRDLEI